MKISDGAYVLFYYQANKNWLTRVEKNKKLHTHIGIIDFDQILGLEYGSSITTAKQKKVYLIEPTIYDYVMKSDRKTQIVYPKDLGYIAIRTGLKSGSNVLENALSNVKDEFGIEGIVHGGISSNFQKKNFEKICSDLELSVFSPLWNLNPSNHLRRMIDEKFKIIIIGVSAMGLDREWLGIQLDHENVQKLELLSSKFGFNLNFEGGEAETLVVDCPIYKKKLEIRTGMVKWYGDNGIFEITDYELIDK